MTSDARTSGMQQKYPTRSAIVSWMLFDWAAKPFFTLITTFVFAPYFATHVAPDPANGQSLWGFATAAAGLIIALMSPVLGAIADASGRRKPWIAAFGAMLVIGSCLMWFGEPGEASAIPPLLLAYGIATIGVEFATVFNNAIMPSLVPPDNMGRLSGTACRLCRRHPQSHPGARLFCRQSGYRAYAFRVRAAVRSRSNRT